MKRILIVLMLVLSLTLPAALAESATPYTPGSITENLFAEAFNQGDLVALDMQFNLALAENATELFGEDEATLSAVCELLNNATFTVGAGMIDNGLRVMLAGDYTKDAASANLSATLDLTLDGLALTSSAIPGESVSAKWETLLAIAGVSEEEIASIMSMRDADFDALFAELLAQLQPMIEMAMQIAAPYGETVLSHLAALPVEINENVPAEGKFPAAASEIHIQISEKAVGDLLVALAQQLKQDATLCAIIDAMLAGSATPEDPAPTTAQLCDTFIQTIPQEFADEARPLNIHFGSDETGTPLYLNILQEYEDGTFLTFAVLLGTAEETGIPMMTFDLATTSADGTIIDGFTFVLSYDADIANPNVMNAEMTLLGYLGGAEVFSMSLFMDNAVADYEGHSGYAGQMAMILDGVDGEISASINMGADVTSILYAPDSEEITAVGNMTVSGDGQTIPLTFEVSMLTEMIDGAPVSVMTESAQLPELGIASWQESYKLYTIKPQTDSVTDIAFETASPEALEALATRALTSLETTLTTLVELLPQKLLESPQETAQP